MKTKLVPVPCLIVTLAVLAFLFPPADRVLKGMKIGDVFITEPGIRTEGFTFIANIGGNVVIRYPQWIVELIALGAASFLVVRKCGLTKSEPRP